jgi:hypothetical protein
VIVDVDDGLTLWALLDEATKDCAPYQPLTGQGAKYFSCVCPRGIDDHVHWSISGPMANTTGRTAGSRYVMTALPPERLVVTSAGVVM